MGQKGKGFILYGPPGVGKTHVARCIAGSAESAFITMSAPDLFRGKYIGSGIREVNKLFDEAVAQARLNKHKTCVVILDEADALLMDRNTSLSNGVTGAERVQAVEAFLSRMDGVGTAPDVRLHFVACTNMLLKQMDPAFKRSGRFGIQIQASPPTEDTALKLLQYFLHKHDVFPVGRSLEYVRSSWVKEISQVSGNLYEYFLIENEQGYVAPLDIEAFVEEAIDEAHQQLKIEPVPVAVKTWWNRSWFPWRRPDEPIDTLSPAIDKARANGNFLELVLNNIQRAIREKILAQRKEKLKKTIDIIGVDESMGPEQPGVSVVVDGGTGIGSWPPQ